MLPGNRNLKDRLISMSEEIGTGEQEYSKRRGDQGGNPSNITFKLKQSSRVNERRRCNEGQEDATEVKGTSQQSHRNICTCIYTHITNRASLIAQLVKNPPVMQETLVRFLGREDALQKG